MFKDEFSEIEKFWKEFTTSRRQRTMDVSILPDHVDKLDQNEFIPSENYLNITISEVWLSIKSKLWDKVEPMVFVATEILYLNPDKGQAEKITLPLVIGQNLLGNLGGSTLPTPEGVSYQNTAVIGPIPFIGGPVTWTIILYQVPSGNSAGAMLQLLDTISGTIVSFTGLETFINVFQAILRGFKMLLETKKPIPLLGKRVVFQVNSPFVLKPGYFVIINAPEESISVENLWVKDGRLLEGSSIQNARPFTKHDFILFNVAASRQREDDMSLDFYPYFRKAIELIPTNLTKAAINMQTLVQEIFNSPDLTRPDKSRLIDKYAKEYKDTVLDYRAILLDINPTQEWREQQESDALSRGKTSYSKDIANDAEDGEESWGEFIIKGLDPRFP